MAHIQNERTPIDWSTPGLTLFQRRFQLLLDPRFGDEEIVIEAKGYAAWRSGRLDFSKRNIEFVFK